MKKHIYPVIVILFLCGCVSSTTTLPSGKPALVFGVYESGHNVTEPKPQASEYLQVEAGGVVVMDEGAGLFLKARVIKHPDHELYITVEYENPGSASLLNDASFKVDATNLNFSVPTVQSGLRSYADYAITVKIWEKKGDPKPVDTLVQKVRSYVDTTGPKPLVFDKLKQG